MYNTLNSIRYAAILPGNEKIGEQLGAFIELLEASVSRKGAFLPLCDEIGLVRSYVSLQKCRYLDGFEAEYHLSETAADCFVPTLPDGMDMRTIACVLDRLADRPVVLPAYVTSEVLTQENIAAYLASQEEEGLV